MRSGLNKKIFLKKLREKLRYNPFRSQSTDIDSASLKSNFILKNLQTIIHTTIDTSN
jgi:hypothetical protein